MVAGLLFSGDFFAVFELNASGIPEMLSGLEWPPMGGDRSKLVVLTSKVAGVGLPIDALALCILDFQAGSSDFGGSVLGDSGRARALSSQLDFEGLHRRESIVLVGLTGKASSSTCSLETSWDPKVVSSASCDLSYFKAVSTAFLILSKGASCENVSGGRASFETP